jgi:hypothetical protein
MVGVTATAGVTSAVLTAEHTWPSAVTDCPEKVDPNPRLVPLSVIESHEGDVGPSGKPGSLVSWENLLPNR